jgi:chemotaxis regulatin CheY-phosphate phosphatase CheZ
MDADDLRSEISSAISVASETGTLLDLVGKGRTTDAFARGHIEYLTDELNDSLKELRESAPAPEIAARFPDSRTLVSSLAKQLSSASVALHNPEALAAIQQHLAKIREALEELKSSL